MIPTDQTKQSTQQSTMQSNTTERAVRRQRNIGG